MVQVSYLSIIDYLSSLDIESQYVSGEEDHIVVTLGQDSKGRDLYLAIRISDLDLSEIKLYQLVQFVAPLPYKISAERVPDVARLLHHINTGLEIPGFEMSEGDGYVYLRYTLPVVNGEIDDAILSSIIGTMEDTVEAYVDQIESLSGNSD